jgi:hypothetical protein
VSKNLLKTKYAFVIAAVALGLPLLPLLGSEHHGTVKFGGLPLPGAAVTAKQGDKSFSAITDFDGHYSFADLPDGAWSLRVEMPLFSPLEQEVTVAAGAPARDWDLKLLPAEQIAAIVTPAPPRLQVAETPAPAAASAKNPPRNGKGPPPPPANTRTAFQRTDLNAAASSTPAVNNENPAPAADSNNTQDAGALSQRAADGLLINGSVNNGASSPFAQLQAFGNNRRGVRSLYNGNLGFSLRNAALDARSFSQTGQDTLKPGYNQMQGLASFGGPFKIPGLLRRNGPNFTVNYQWVHNRNASTQPGLMPTLAQRIGDFSGTPVAVRDPATGLPFVGNVIPLNQISEQAKALLGFYPLPNFTGSTRYNYQVPLIAGQHQDNLQARMNKQVKRNQYSGNFGMQSTRTDNTNLFGFLDTGRTLGMNLQMSWRHTFTPRAFVNIGYQFSRFSATSVPFFANRQNIAGGAGITGNNQEPLNWGPPALSFANGISSLADSQYSSLHNQTNGVSFDGLWNRSRHNITYGTDFRRQQFNTLTQQDPRGTFTFTGLAAGSDFAGFLLGVPDTASIAFGNADKYFRASSYDAFVQDDWRMRSSFTLNVGVRWEYNTPISELYGRLVNLDVKQGFTAVTPVLGLSPTGPLTQQSYPSSLVHPDKNNIAPRLAMSWRPFSASSMVVRASYGIYYDTSVYQTIANQMAQQSPLSKSLRVQNGPGTPLTLANGFIGSPNITANTFAVDPDFRVGYAQTWQTSVQRDLPFALQMVATYMGTKGTRSQQQFLPNTFPAGELNPCPTCPSGFTYLTSNGNSIRHAGVMQLRRRLRSGFTAELQYTFSKSIDDAALGGRGQGGSLIAQDWLNLSGERGLSNFDQRHLLSVTMQYTSGMGLRGGSLVSGWRGALLKEWTTSTQITAGSGLPLTPVYQAVIAGTGVTGIRPNYTGAPLYDAPSGLFLNPAAYTAPSSGHWGNAGRNSIIGPQQFTLNASMARTFRLNDRYSADLRIDAANALNHPTFPSWVTVISSVQFGLPNPANPMRSVQTTIRLRF